jgi:1,4-dihydroxy-2-naphthoate octaprenyltransferase
MAVKTSTIGKTQERNRALAVLRMSRPFILIAAVMANLAGLSMAYYEVGTIYLGKAVLGMLIVLSATVMGHFFDEYADVDTDTITQRTLFSGGSGVLPSGIVPPTWALLGGFLTGLGSLVLTVYGVLAGLLSVDFLIIFLVAVVLGYSYSMPPLRLERRGWGELDNAFLGTLMFFSGYLPQTGSFSTISLIASVPVFLAIMVNLIGVHWADREADLLVGKRTLIVRLKDRSQWLFLVLLVVMYLYILAFSGSFPPQMLGAYLITVPVALWAFQAFRRTGNPFPGSFFMASVFVANIIGWIL